MDDQGAKESARKKKNLKRLENGLSKESTLAKNKLNKKDLSRRHKQLKLILTNKPVSFFDPDASKKLQEDVEKMNQECEEEQQNKFIYQDLEAESTSQ